MQGQDTKREKQDNGMYLVTCAVCGDEFEAKRSDASYCSTSCRKRNHYSPVKRQNALEELDSMIKRLHSIRMEYQNDKAFFEKFCEMAQVAAYQANSYSDKALGYNSGHIPVEMREKTIKSADAAAARMNEKPVKRSQQLGTDKKQPKTPNRKKCPHCGKTSQSAYDGDLGMWHCYACGGSWSHYE